MGGLVLDIVIEYFYRVVAALVLRTRSRNWPTTDGTVFRTHVPRKGYGCKLVVVRYRYFVGGTKYLAIHKEPFLFDPTGGFMRQYARSQRIVVRYKPDAPSRSVALI